MTRDGSAPMVAARDDGSATLWVLALVLVVWVSVAGILLAGMAITARHRAASAADLAALSAASVLAAAAPFAAATAPATGPTRPTTGSAPACARADRIAAANGATISSCQVSGAVVEVTATVTIDALRYLGAGAVSARARAGQG
jgi:hypothetical protein